MAWSFALGVPWNPISMLEVDLIRQRFDFSHLWIERADEDVCSMDGEEE
jgi:hypothetical protein